MLITGARAGGTPGDRTADRTGTRRGNAALLLEVLRADGPLSRATLARRTGLAKTAVSLLVADLVGRGLVREGSAPAGAPGRPGQLVEIAPAAVVALGLVIDADGVSAGLVDLAGALLVHRRATVDVAVAGPAGALDALTDLTADVLAAAPAGVGRLVGTTVAVPGVVDPGTGVVRAAPGLGWRDVPLGDLLAGRGAAGGAPVSVDNDAALAAVAEAAVGVAAGVPDLVCVLGGTGVGGGVVAGGRLLRGARGAAGEIGHLTVDPVGPYCACGRRGCWETQVGLGALLAACAAPGDRLHDPALGLAERLATVRERAGAGDPRTLAALRQVGSALGAGAAVLATVLDPAVVVLAGWYAELADLLLPAATAALAERSPVHAAHPRLVASGLGGTAVVRGGAEVALRRVLADPTAPAAGPSTVPDRIGARA